MNSKQYAKSKILRTVGLKPLKRTSLMKKLFGKDWPDPKSWTFPKD